METTNVKVGPDANVTPSIGFFIRKHSLVDNLTFAK